MRSPRDTEWELAKDRELDELDDRQLLYLHSAIEVTLEDRAWYRDPTHGWRRIGSPSPAAVDVPPEPR